MRLFSATMSFYPDLIVCARRSCRGDPAAALLPVGRNGARVCRLLLPSHPAPAKNSELLKIFGKHMLLFRIILLLTWHFFPSPRTTDLQTASNVFQNPRSMIPRGTVWL